jgi:hypothetical protein
MAATGSTPALVPTHLVWEVPSVAVKGSEPLQFKAGLP